MITKNFIKMCEKAEEIQKAWKPRFGDYCREKEYKSLMIIVGVVETHDIRCVSFEYRRTGYKAERYLKNNIIYLPTQEQLIEIHFDWYLQRYKGKMLISEYLLYLGEFAEIAEDSDYKYYSLKEMMLGYLYQEKYHKIWNGKEWIDVT